jgi:hypothetical protein
MQTRSLLRVTGLVVIAATVAASAPSVAHETSRTAVEITVFKSPTCGCCSKWVDHLRKHAEGTAFTVIAKDTSDMTGVKTTAGVPEKVHSCHTAFVGGYVVEGHVPAEDILRMLKEKPRVAGIAAPGMPVGSPGMEVGSRQDAYDVVAFKRDGSTSLFAKH